MKTIYTCIVGGYDDLKQPINLPTNNHHGWKFICYADTTPKVIDAYEQEITDTIWEIRPLRYIDDNPAKVARWHKINFDKCVETDESMWIDATFFINQDLNRWWKNRVGDKDFVCINHPFDNCAYVDIQSCIGAGKGDFFKLVDQAQDYKKEGLPFEAGLISSGLLMRRKTDEVINFCREWWAQVHKYTERDQPCFSYANWKNPVAKFINWDYTSRNEFIHVPHLWKQEKRKYRLKEIKNNL